MNQILTQKTTWTGVAAVIAAAGGFFTGTMGIEAAIQMAFTGLLAIFLRQGVAKGK